MPVIKKKFVEYHEYADATINDIFSREELKDATLLNASLLSTVYLENNGNAGFIKRDLPPEAQYAPVFAIASVDANGDGKKDIVLAGNNSWSRIKFVRYDAG